ncbi:Mobile element protein [hydrothermal vent metagenome]|uniref:Mobile element protein n=1 Tax=hydrothermal vent metagenome TaxID=652676 RepID=A0A3B1AH06_9ZZZZ
MQRFQISQSDKETYVTHSGLVLVGLGLKHSGIAKALKKWTHRHGSSHGDCMKSYIGLLSIGKSDFDAIENRRHDRYFKKALGIKKVPSAPTLRQRFDKWAPQFIPLVDAASVDLISALKAPVTPLSIGHVALDIDVFPMDNSRTKKQHVSRTYKGYDGYAPIAAYLGNEGWCLACELRQGKQHCQKEFLHTLDRILPRARRLTDKPLLVRLDSGHDAKENRFELAEQNVDFLIKWNPRAQDINVWMGVSDDLGTWEQIRDGKRVCIFDEQVTENYYGETRSFRKVTRLTERTIDKHGQRLLIPDIRLEGWWTTLDEKTADNETVIALYKDHATSEQFHSEFKTDLDIERLPSGKFDTNDLVMALAVITYNILRWIGLIGLIGDVSPVRHPAKRRRLKTVMQELMYLAARMIETGRALKLKFSKHCPGFQSFEKVYNKLAEG